MGVFGNNPLRKEVEYKQKRKYKEQTRFFKYHDL